MPIIQAPPLSESLLQTIERAEAMHGFIQAHIPDSFILDTTRVMLIAALFSLVEEHHGAILHLFRTGQHDGSAAALVRPLIDACYRAHWIHACAKPETVKRIRAGDDECFPGLRPMAEQVEEKIDSGEFFLTILPSIKALHGYTHGGLEQITRRFSPDGSSVQPNYPDAEKQEAINLTTAHFTALALS